jgi:Cd2+/Zn2+-exporting ATPase
MSDDGSGPAHLWESREVRWSAASGALLLIGVLLTAAGANDLLTTGIFISATIVGVRFFAFEALEMLSEHRVIGIELLMTIAALIAGLLGLWGEAASLAFLYSISEALEEFTEERASNAIRALMDLAPKRVTLIDEGGSQRDVDADEVIVGDRFLVRPGEAVATDGVVVDGASAVDESAITGEPTPVDKSLGDDVFAGTMNSSGALIVEARATALENTLTKIVDLVSEAQEKRGKGEVWMRRFSRRYSPAVLAGGALIAVVGGLATGDWSTWLARAATVIVAAAPCALVISIPVTYVAAIGNAGRRGILIKGGVHLEELGVVSVMALDKTGTLTEGRPEVSSVTAADGVSAKSLISIAAGVEQRSEHPLARAIMRYVEENQIETPPVSAFEAMVGSGARATIAGTDYVVGSPSFVESKGIGTECLAEEIVEAQRRAATVVVVADGSRPLGIIALADPIRANAPGAVDALHAAGLRRIVMLTGDGPITAQAVADRVGVDAYLAELKPADKAVEVERLGAGEGSVAMVGDGVNDAPALATADVGIAMGAAGSDVALETADVVLMSDDLDRLVDAVSLGRRTRAIVRQNLVLSGIILVALVPMALFGFIALPVTVLAHELSEFAVIGNGMRMAR